MAPHASESFDDLLAALDATSARGRQMNAIRSESGPRIPQMHHLTQPEWRPLPKLDDVRQSLKTNASNKFIRFQRNEGIAFDEPKFLKPKVLGVWVAAKVGAPERNFPPSSNHNHRFPPRFHSHSEPFPEPTDEMLDPLHREWLQKHNDQRTNHIYHISAALEKVEKAKKVYENHKVMREKATDIISRPVLQEIKLGEKAKRGLAKAKFAVKVGRAMNQTVNPNHNPLKEEEERDKKRLEKAKSAPELQYYRPPPISRPKHLRSFQLTTTASGSFRTTTPWQHNDEMQDLKTMGRRTW